MCVVNGIEHTAAFLVSNAADNGALLFWSLNVWIFSNFQGTIAMPQMMHGWYYARLCYTSMSLIAHEMKWPAKYHLVRLVPHRTVKVSWSGEVEQHQWIFRVWASVYVDATMLRESPNTHRDTHQCTVCANIKHFRLQTHPTRNECRHKQRVHSSLWL